MPGFMPVWDLLAPGGPVCLPMPSVGAAEAVRNDPGRYCFTLPAGAEPGPAEYEHRQTLRERDAQDERDAAAEVDAIRRRGGAVGPPAIGRNNQVVEFKGESGSHRFDLARVLIVQRNRKFSRGPRRAGARRRV